MRFWWIIPALLASFACGGPTQAPAPEAKVEAPKPKPPDESRRFPKENQASMELVDDHVLGKDFLPGGNVATYEKDGKSYQLFLIVMKDAETASLKMFDLKGALTDAKFVASFGGYYRLDGETPWFVFAKERIGRRRRPAAGGSRSRGA
ncbi:MAG: DUF6599 family protein [Bryobacterales bacterium]